jgi:hypothetical protein
MILECLLLNWGVELFLILLLAFSEYLGKTKRFKENSIIDWFKNTIKKMLGR